MAFHISNFGQFGGGLRRFADIDGYVPQPGDKPEAFRWEGGTDWTAEEWREHVAQAEAQTREAQRAVDAWRDSETGTDPS